MTVDDPDLACLDNVEIAALATEFATISGSGYVEVAAWAERWYWTTTSEMADRAGRPREAAPLIVTLADLPEAQLRFVRSFFAYELPVLADTLGAERLAAWCRAMGRRAVAETGRRAREVAESSAVLAEYIDGQRRAGRPIGSPNTMPSWAELKNSRPDRDDGE